MEGRLLGMQDVVGSTPIAGSEVNSLASRHSFVEATEEEAVIIVGSIPTRVPWWYSFGEGAPLRLKHGSPDRGHITVLRV